MSRLAEGRRRRLAAATGALAGVERQRAADELGGGRADDLLIAEGVTILDLHGLLSPHMFIGLVLIPPVAAQAREHGLPVRALLHGRAGLPGQGTAAAGAARAGADPRGEHADDLRHRRLAAAPRPPLRPGAHAAQGRLHRLVRRLRRALPRLRPARGRSLGAAWRTARPRAGRGRTAAQRDAGRVSRLRRARARARAPLAHDTWHRPGSSRRGTDSAGPWARPAR